VHVWRRIVSVVAASIVAVMFGALIGLRLLLHIDEVSPSEHQVAPANVVAAIAQVPAERFEAVGQGNIQELPIPVRTRLALDPTGRVVIMYIGAEWCARCAAERWPLTVALGRFGQFLDLRITASGPDDGFLPIPTFSFYGAQYYSGLIDFASVELQSNDVRAGQFIRLQSPSQAQQQLMRKYDSPPYVAAASTGELPFIDVADQYVIAGAGFDPAVLADGTWQTIASSLSGTTSAQARAMLGSANVLTAAICAATGDRPLAVCQQPVVSSLEAVLARKAVPSI
jgi:hypothetical protein